MGKILTSFFICLCFSLNGFGQIIDENNGNIIGFNRIVTPSGSWMDIQLSGNTSSFKIHDNTNGSNWVRWDAGSAYTEFLKDVHINTGILELSAGNNKTHALFKGSFAGIQGIQVERQGGDNIRLVANYSGYGSGLESSSALRFAVNGDQINNPSVYIKVDGNVGIGTTSPDKKLTVAGTVKSREVIVEENTGADFVFEEDYELSSLSELEAFIKTNKHLPEIPTADQMKAEGVKVGELQMKLLQKIEELMLYAIEQEKRDTQKDEIIKELIQRIEQLESNKETP